MSLGAWCDGDVLGKPDTLLHVGGYKYWAIDPTP
jgi:hypothetical protein